MSKKSITAKMEEMRKFIELTLSNTNELEAAVAAGFTKKEFEAKLSQYNQIVEKRQEYTFAFNRRKAATKALNGAKDALWEHYISLVGYARDIFEDDTEKYTFLSLEGERDKDYKEMKFQAFQFYTAILQNNPILNAFVKEKISKAHIEYGIKLYQDMLELKKFQESAELLRSEEHDEFEESKLGLEKWYSKTKKRLKNWSKISATLVEEQEG